MHPKTPSPAGRAATQPLWLTIGCLTVLSIAATHLIAKPPRGAKRAPDRQVHYAIKGNHRTGGTFAGTLTATLRGQRAQVTQVMTFPDGRSETVRVSGSVKGSRFRGTTSSTYEARGAAKALARLKGDRGASRRRTLQVIFGAGSVKSRLTEGAPKSKEVQVVATASGALQAEPVDQGLSPGYAKTWHERTHGLSIIPTSWFKALEQADRPALFSDPDHMRRFGFLPGGAEGLPVGFAILGQRVGLNCAACHTAEIDVAGTPVRIEGGRGNVDLDMFRQALGQALAATAQTPDKFSRFAARVLQHEGRPVTPDAVQGVGESVKAYLLGVKAKNEAAKRLGLTSATVAGPGRVDAYNNGANALLGPLNPRNYAPAKAPVRLPYLWGTASFSWVQYNGGIRLPLTRNLIASVAAGAQLDIIDDQGNLLPPDQRYGSSSKAVDLAALEDAMRQIRAPKWPGYVDADASRRGARLFRQRCFDCHERKSYTRAGKGERLRELRMFPLDVIGTDPGEARSFMRKVDATKLGLGASTPLPEALKAISNRVLAKQGYAPNRPNDMRAIAAYRARPLDGIWAAAPYLHNGSVLTLYELLGPASERRKTFRLSTQPALDVERLGLVEPKAGFVFDTTQPGNANSGHEFRDAPKGTPGVVGPALTRRQRLDLIEFLKTR